MDKDRDIDMANVSENISDLGDKTTGTEGGNIQGGSGGLQGRQQQSEPGRQGDAKEK